MIKGAPSGAFFMSGKHGWPRQSYWQAAISLPLILIFTGNATANDCRRHAFDDSATVAYVVDGDTLRLDDGRKVRLIGINTPEIAHKGKRSRTSDEPLARKARTTVRALLPRKARVYLKFGRQPHDRYHRLLAHVYLNDGRNLSAILLKKGLASQIIFPPNTFSLRCYQEAEKHARKQRLGIWNEPYYHPLDSQHLPPKLHGFHFIRGRVSHIERRQHTVWLNLGDDFAVKINRKDLQHFTTSAPTQWSGREIIVRGWVNHHHKKAIIRARHPASIEIIS